MYLCINMCQVVPLHALLPDSQNFHFPDPFPVSLTLYFFFSVCVDKSAGFHSQCVSPCLVLWYFSYSGHVFSWRCDLTQQRQQANDGHGPKAVLGLACISAHSLCTCCSLFPRPHRRHSRSPFTRLFSGGECGSSLTPSREQVFSQTRNAGVCAQDRPAWSCICTSYCLCVCFPEIFTWFYFVLTQLCLF